MGGVQRRITRTRRTGGGEMSSVSYKKAKKRWEIAFEKKMTHEEEVMFNWGYAFATQDIFDRKEESQSEDNTHHE